MLTPDMKRIIEEQRLGFVATAFVTPTPGAAEPNKALYELQERCAKVAGEVFQKKWGDGIVKDKTGEIAANYENHYNARLNNGTRGNPKS